jgi:hypothetical protein
VRCYRLPPARIGTADYTPYLCTPDTQFWRTLSRLAVVSRVTARAGLLWLERPMLYPVLDRVLGAKTLRQWLEAWREIRRYGLPPVREAYSLGSAVQALTPEPEAFEKLFDVKIAEPPALMTMAKHVAKLLDAMLGATGPEGAYRMMYRTLQCAMRLALGPPLRPRKRK